MALAWIASAVELLLAGAAGFLGGMGGYEWRRVREDRRRRTEAEMELARAVSLFLGLWREYRREGLDLSDVPRRPLLDDLAVVEATLVHHAARLDAAQADAAAGLCTTVRSLLEGSGPAVAPAAGMRRMDEICRRFEALVDGP